MLHTQPLANKGVTENEGNPNILFNEIDEALKKGDPIRTTATKGSFGSTPNLKSCPFKTTTDIGKSSREEHEELKHNTHASLLSANPRWKRTARPDALDNEEVELFAIIAWSIWNQQNRVHMHQPSCSTHLLAATAKERLAEFLSVQPPAPLPIPKPRVQWQPPPQRLVKINFDGATSKDQMLGIGVVLRNERDSILASLSQNIPQVANP
nr:hypothetical protein CFP56_36113 [Quercus suber]